MLNTIKDEKPSKSIDWWSDQPRLKYRTTLLYVRYNCISKSKQSPSTNKPKRTQHTQFENNQKQWNQPKRRSVVHLRSPSRNRQIKSPRSTHVVQRIVVTELFISHRTQDNSSKKANRTDTIPKKSDELNHFRPKN